MISRVALLVLVTVGAMAAEKRSGYGDASPETRAMQDDDGANPGFLWIGQGQSLWSTPAGPAAKSCDSCHGAAAAAMRGVAARYPAYDTGARRMLNLEQRINQCRVERQGAAPLAQESEGLLALAAFIGLQSRGLPIEARIDGPAQPAFEQGRALFAARQGQLNLSCKQCHDDLAGQRLAGNVIPQGHANGYPLYRLEWQGMGSFYRRLRNCMTGVRAEPFAADAPETVALELYLAWRAQGLKVETPAVRP